MGIYLNIGTQRLLLCYYFDHRHALPKANKRILVGGLTALRVLDFAGAEDRDAPVKNEHQDCPMQGSLREKREEEG